MFKYCKRCRFHLDFFYISTLLVSREFLDSRLCAYYGSARSPPPPKIGNWLKSRTRTRKNNSKKVFKNFVDQNQKKNNSKKYLKNLVDQLLPLLDGKIALVNGVLP